jgi:hypothetical protein
MKANAYQGITKTEKIEALADFTTPPPFPLYLPSEM